MALPRSPGSNQEVRRLVLILLAVAGLITLAILYLDEGLAPPRETGNVDQIVGDSANHEQGTIGASVSVGESAGERAQVSAALTGYDLLLDTAATGYTGRVVSAANEPVPGIGVTLMQLSAVAAVPFDMDVFSRTPASPRFVVGEAVSDREGRFVLSGVAPRGMCFLQLAFADVEAAQQAIVDVVRRLEEQGEVIIEGRGGGEEIVA